MIKQLLLVTFVTLIAYLGIFRNQFVIDDHVFIGPYHPNFAQSFMGSVPPGHEGVYRPLRGILYTLYHHLWGTNIYLYHLHSLLIHLISTFLVYFIVKKIAINWQLTTKYLPFITAMLFGLHPVHTETITYITSSMDSLGLVFYLLAFYLYLNNKLVRSLIFTTLAFFTTEMTLTLPIIILYHDWIFQKLTRGKVPYYLTSFGLVGLYATIRFLLLDITTRGPYLAQSFYLTMLTMSRVLLKYLQVLLWPFNLSSNHIIAPGIEAFVYRNYRVTAIAAQSILDLEILLPLTVIIIIILLVIRLKPRFPLISFSLGWIFLTLLPVMEFVPQGSMMNERSLYLASIGYLILLALFVLQIWNQRTNLGVLTLIVISLLYLNQTISRNRDWLNDITIWQADISQNPQDNAYAYYSLGNAWNDRRDYLKAVDAYAEAVKINPGMAVGWASLGRTYNDLGDTTSAIKFYEHALTLDPNFWEVRHNLNNIYSRL